MKSGVKFGCVRGGSTEKFFKNSPNPIYRQAWEKMTSEGIMTTNNAEVGSEIKRVSVFRTGLTAFAL